MTVGILASIIVAALLAQVSAAALVWLDRRRRRYREMDGQTGDPRAASTPQEPTPLGMDGPATAWEGFREFWVRRREVEDENGSICSFYLVPVDGQPLSDFRPGQYLTFRLPIEDPATRRTRTVVRCYSLSDRSRPDCYRVSIKRVPPPPDRPEAPPGLSSNFFHDHVQTGTTLMVKAPSGHFHLMEEASLPLVLIAGGIGITPMLSIANTLLEGGSRREIWLYYGVRNGAEQIMKERLRELARVHDNFHLHLCCSSPGAGDVEGVDYRHQGRIDIPLLRATLMLMRYQFYVCGPKPMMESLVPGLEEWGVESGDIHYESFGPASLAWREKPKTRAEGPITVTFGKSGTRIPWSPDAGSLLELAEVQGIEVESGCRAGSCGSCRTRVEAGEIEYSQQPDADLEPGHCLLCIETPKGDLILNA